MQKAVIDIGTNTFHLLIANVVASEFTVLKKLTIPVKLGEGGISKAEIIPAAFQRGLDALIAFREELNNYHVEHITATATAAVRDASNGQQFIQEAYEKANIEIKIIDGQQEALYIYEGAKAAGALTSPMSLIMDIGGGSTEFLLANENQVFWKQSYRIGAARLLADFYKSDPLNSQDIKLIETHLQNTLQELIEACKEYQPINLIGTAGSFDSYTTLTFLRNKKKEDKNQIIAPLEKEGFLKLLQEIIKSTHQQREEMEGLIPLRTDMILMSSIISRYILKTTNITQVIACKYALKEGLLLSE